jgi:hypothetical protein
MTGATRGMGWAFGARFRDKLMGLVHGPRYGSYICGEHHVYISMIGSPAFVPEAIAMIKNQHLYRFHGADERRARQAANPDLPSV